MRDDKSSERSPDQELLEAAQAGIRRFRLWIDRRFPAGVRTLALVFAGGAAVAFALAAVLLQRVFAGNTCRRSGFPDSRAYLRWVSVAVLMEERRSTPWPDSPEFNPRWREFIAYTADNEFGFAVNVMLLLFARFRLV
jgi:hypothetical protein